MYDRIESLLSLSTLLDPRVKQTLLKNEKAKLTVFQLIEESISFYHIEINTNEALEEKLDNTIKKVKINDSKLSSIFGLTSQTKTSLCSKDKGIRSYLNEEEILIDEDPFQWWDLNQRKYRHLSALTRMIMSTPCTSVPSERVFSKTGLIVNNLRSSLNSKNVDQLIFSAHNQAKVFN